MSLHGDALAVLRDWPAPDGDQEHLRREYVAHLEAHPDGADRSCHPAHLTAGALILSADAEQVLLTLHAKAKRWFHMGGHCEPRDERLVDTAAREAAEESGVAGLRVDPLPLHLDAHDVAFCSGHQQVRHLDVRFLARAPRRAAHAVSDESDDVRWWPVHALPTDDADMLRLVALALQRAQSTSAAG